MNLPTVLVLLALAAALFFALRAIGRGRGCCGRCGGCAGRCAGCGERSSEKGP